MRTLFGLGGLVTALGLALPLHAQAGAPALALPLACVVGETCAVQHYVDRDPGPGVLDYRCQHRTYQAHNGVDIRLMTMAAQRAGVAVLAAAPGRVARLRDGVPDISIRAPGAASVKGMECGNGLVIDHGDGWETQYCHMARGSIGVKVGEAVAAGKPIGKVGLSGDTEFPHLHFTVRHAGVVVDPFAPEPGAAPQACKAQPSLWTAEAARQLAYKSGEILNAGWADRPVADADIDGGGLAAPSKASGVLVAYVRLIGLAQGDEVELILTAPGGAVLAQARNPPLDHDKDTYTAYVGRKLPAGGWPAGTYAAQFRILRTGKPVAAKTIKLAI